MDFANLPYIIDGDFKLSETYAVLNYIAQKYCPELIGTTPQEKARCHQLMRLASDQLVPVLFNCLKNEGDRTDAVVKILDGLEVLGKLFNDDR